MNGIENMETLAKQAKADTDHDFHLSATDKGIFTNMTYNKGLPNSENISDDLPMNEVNTLNSNMSPDDGSKSNQTLSSFADYTTLLNNDDRTSITIQNYAPGLPAGQYSVSKILNVAKTSNGYKAADIKNLTAETFINTLGIRDRAAIVIDAVAISIIDILKSGSAYNNTIYYAMTPEITNDPAGKTSCKVVKQLNANIGVNLVPIIEKNSSERMYNYDQQSSNSFNQFFTKYNFTLSNMKTGKGLNLKSYHYNDVTVEDPQFANNSKFKVTISESKKQNNINTLLSFLKNLLKKLSGTSMSKSSVDIFNMNREFQQKRAGDWLQVLLCKNLMSRNMALFTEFSAPNGGASVDDISEVWFITHDQIALAFALYSGVNCIFTHGSSGSIYSFRLNNPVEAMATQLKIRDALELKRSEYISKLSQIQANVKSYMDLRNSFFKNNYIDKLTVDTTETQWNTATAITKLTKGKIGQTQVNKSNIDNIVQEIFQIAYKYSYVAQIKPDFTDMANNLTSLNSILSSPIPTMSTSNEPSTDEIKNSIDINNKYKEYFAQIGNYDQIINNYGAISGNSWQPYSFELVTGATVPENKEFKKSYPKFQIELQPSYKMIDKYNWSGVNFNLRKFMASFGEKEYKMDSCLFLYDIKNLEDDVKVNILTAFLNYDTSLEITTDDTGITSIKESNDAQTKKYYYVMKGFCQQVYIAIGGYVNDNDLINNIKNKISTYKSSISNVDSFTVTDPNISDFDKTLHIICDSNTVSENNMYLQQISSESISNDYIYGDILDINEPNIRQQKISNLCDKTVGIDEPTPPECENANNVDNQILTQGNQIGGALQVNVSEYLSISNDVKQVTYAQLASFLDTTSWLTNYNKYSASQLKQILQNELLLETDDMDVTDNTPEYIINQISSIVDITENDSTKDNSAPAQKRRRIRGGGVEKQDDTHNLELQDNDLESKSKYILAIGAIFAVGNNTSMKNMDMSGGSNVLGVSSTCKDIQTELGCNNNVNCSWDTNKSQCLERPSADNQKPSADKTNVAKLYKQLISGEKTPLNLFSLGFHPLLPIYVLLQGMYNLSFDHIDESLDYRFIIRYFNFLQTMRRELENMYNLNISRPSNETSIRQMAAYIIGYSISLLFIELNMLEIKVNPTYIDNNSNANISDTSDTLYISKYFDMTASEYTPIFLLSKNISEEVVGSSSIEITNELSYSIQNKLVINFFNKINIKNIFTSELTETINIVSLEEFQQQIYNELIYTGEQIITSRTEVSVTNMKNTIDEQTSFDTPSSPSSPCQSGKYKSHIDASGNIVQVCDENAAVPFKGKTMTMSDIRSKEEYSPDTVYSTSSIDSKNSTNSRTSNRGGKNKKHTKSNKTKKIVKKRKHMKTKKKNNKSSKRRHITKKLKHKNRIKGKSKQKNKK